MYVIKHYKDGYKIPIGYEPLYVGPLFTDTGTDNINHLNPYINELTGLYYLWKNTHDPIVGMCHYHRFFTENDKPIRAGLAEDLARDHDIILVYPVCYETSIIDNLEHDFRDDLPTFHKYMDMLYEKEPGLKGYFEWSTFNPRNMLIARREVIEGYCEWLFPLIIPITEQFIREEVHKWGPGHYYRRMIGFIAERLLTYYVRKNGFDYYELPYSDL
jgi:hypothetical protein